MAEQLYGTLQQTEWTLYCYAMISSHVVLNYTRVVKLAEQCIIEKLEVNYSTVM